MNVARSTLCGTLTRMQQHVMVAQVRDILLDAPLSAAIAVGGAPMGIRISAAGALGWVANEGYRYQPKQPDGRPWPAIPDSWRELANGFAGEQPWDSAIINWYAPGVKLGLHVDRDEYDQTRPIVSFSLGDAASWAVRDPESRDLSRTRLESGDVTLLAGPLRGAEHSIERVIPAPLFNPLGVPGRVSVTLRVAGRVDFSSLGYPLSTPRKTP